MKVVFQIDEQRLSILVVVSRLQLTEKVREYFLIGLHLDVHRGEIFLQLVVRTKLASNFCVVVLHAQAIERSQPTRVPPDRLEDHLCSDRDWQTLVRDSLD